ncbi:MAG: response regulator [Pseudomonadota bacterium]
MTPAAPKPRFRVALQGFSEFERSALASYFRLAGDRYPAYEQTPSMDDAAFVVADADDAAAVQRVLQAGRVHDTVFIGAQAPEGGLAWMMRPIDPMHVLRELDGAIAMRQAGAAGAAGASREVGGGMPVHARRASDLPEPARTVSPQVLVVDGDEPAARALERDIAALGLSVARANTSAQALELLGRLAFRFVFADVDLGPQSELDGLNLCQHIKRRQRAAGVREPAVFLLTGRDVAVDRVRAALAGSDAFVNKPVDEATLRRLLASHGARFTRPGQRMLQR